MTKHARSPRAPNLVFVFTDEQRYDTMRCYGNDWIQTPHLNRLAEQSFVFRRAYVTQTVCTPSRASIMTGLYPHTNGCTANNIPLRPDTATLAEMIGPQYARGYVGKWHLGDEVIGQHGFDNWVSIEDMYRPHYSRPEYLGRLSDYHHFLAGQGVAPDIESREARVFSRTLAARQPESRTKARFVGREAAAFIRENRGRPFAVYVNFLEPHMPFTGPLDELYDPDEIAVGPTFQQAPGPDASLLHRRMADYYLSREMIFGLEATGGHAWRRVRARYMGLVTLVDRALGEILSALDESGAADNTIVVFTSDHGDMMGEHGMFAKTVLYEDAMRVPLLMRVPWMAKHQTVIDGPISQIDLVPTLLDLMRQGVPGHLEGRSRAGVLAGSDNLDRNDVVVEWNGPDSRQHVLPGRTQQESEALAGPWRSIIGGDGWKLNLSRLDQSELYDLNEDPAETRNLFDDPGQQRRIRDMTERIRAWQQQTRDGVVLL